jgi:hypothetical protein
MSMPKVTVFIALTLVCILIRPVEVSTAAGAKYEFTSDWVTAHTKIWSEHLNHLKGNPNVHALEIGSFEGRSAVWALQNILIHPTATITCVDIFAEQPYENRFDRNIQASGSAHKVRKIKDSSQKALTELKWNSYDFIYIDGSHIAKDVFIDAALSWNLLKPGGIVIFDDYRWQVERYASWKRPEVAIDAFLKVFEPYVQVTHKGYQVIVRKREAAVLEEDPPPQKNSLKEIKRFFKSWLRPRTEKNKEEPSPL